MSLIQRVFYALFPARWAASMEASSRQWILHCLTCDHEQSVWDAGGIRWKAASVAKRKMVRCPHCQAVRWASMEHRTPEASDPA